jgi:hypothetical protein
MVTRQPRAKTVSVVALTLNAGEARSCGRRQNLTANALLPQGKRPRVTREPNGGAILQNVCPPEVLAAHRSGAALCVGSLWTRSVSPKNRLN